MKGKISGQYGYEKRRCLLLIKEMCFCHLSYAFLVPTVYVKYDENKKCHILLKLQKICLEELVCYLSLNLCALLVYEAEFYTRAPM